MILIRKYKKLFILIGFVMIMASCVEEIALNSEDFEEAIVIEGLVTNELKKHEIKISQTFAIDSTGPKPVSGADIRVTGEEEHIFQELEPGRYISLDSFAARPGINYQLSILVNGNEYISEPTQLSGSSSIGELEANRINYRGEDGVAITLNNQTSAGGANYYNTNM